MTAWTTDELTKIGTAEELQIAYLRRDGTPADARPRERPALSLGSPPSIRGSLNGSPRSPATG